MPGFLSKKIDRINNDSKRSKRSVHQKKSPSKPLVTKGGLSKSPSLSNFSDKYLFHRILCVFLVIAAELLLVLLMHFTGLWLVISTIDRLFIVIWMIVILFFSASRSSLIKTDV